MKSLYSLLAAIFWMAATSLSRTSPGTLHPLVYVHPETRRPALYLGRRRNAYIMGMEVAESEALLDTLWEHATQDFLTWHHQWRAGDVVVWDNRCVMHWPEPERGRMAGLRLASGLPGALPADPRAVPGSAASARAAVSGGADAIT